MAIALKAGERPAQHVVVVITATVATDRVHTRIHLIIPLIPRRGAAVASPVVAQGLDGRERGRS